MPNGYKQRQYFHKQSKHPKRPKKKPNLKLVLLILLTIFLYCAFTGIQPMASYKDTITSGAGKAWKWVYETSEGTYNATVSFLESEKETPLIEQVTEPTQREIVTPIPAAPRITPIPIPTMAPIPVLSPSDNEEARWIPVLKDPSWSQLLEFLKWDNTDKHPYTYPSFVCEDFARTLQSNAKKAGWKCAIVSIQLSGYPDWYHYGIPSNTSHALNAFETTDRGLIYIDCTRPGMGFTGSADSTVEVKVGKDYIPVLIWPTPGWHSSGPSCGIVEKIESTSW